MDSYIDFLKRKAVISIPTGLDGVPPISDKLFPFQREIVRWALHRGRAAIFADCGLGKSAMQLEWAKHVPGNVLILAPLAVSQQTLREAEKFGIPACIARSDKDITEKIAITNYEILDHFDPKRFNGVVLDESSILKSYMGKRKCQILEMFQDTPFKLACTATPSPNDHLELLNHSDFLGIMRACEALAIWFINDGSTAGNYRLKKHAIRPFWRWVSSWAVTCSKPSDIGFDDAGYDLPSLNVVEDILEIEDDTPTEGYLFRFVKTSATEFHKEKKLTTNVRAKRTAEIVTENPNDQFLVWCEANYEADALKKMIPDAVEVRGNDKSEVKEKAALDFIDGKIRVLISKPSIFGFGLNFQNCHRTIFCGLNYSYESFYQAVRRVWRFGQRSPVEARIVIGSTEEAILKTIKRKESQHREMVEQSIRDLREIQIENIHKHEFRLNIEKPNITIPS